MRRPIFATLVYLRPICITLAWLVITILLIVLTGCSTQAVPVKPKFPEPIQSLMVPCPDLKEVQQTTKLSEVVSGVTKIMVCTTNVNYKMICG